MLRQFKTSSATAFTQYTRAIHRTHKLLSDSVLDSLSSTQRSALLEHFRKETRAYDKYMRERRKLWSALMASERPASISKI
jgi:predicted membrane chloride channel (bestrophin family)